MREDEVIRLMKEHLEGLFPKVCGNCGRRFATLREYIQITEHKVAAMPYDAAFSTLAIISLGEA